MPAIRILGHGAAWWTRRILRAVANWRNDDPERVVGQLIAAMRLDEARACRGLSVDEINARIKLHQQGLK